jgi:NAD+ kinase
MKTVGMVLNPTLGDRVATVARELLAYLEPKGIKVLLLDEHAPLIGANGVSKQVLRKVCDCIFALGGDGTLLSAVQIIAPSGIPVLGINLGGLGFLSELGPEELYAGLERIMAGGFRIEERMLLRGKVERGGETTKEVVCLNDFVVGRGALSRPCRLEVRVDGYLAMRFNGDGIIISTPTGSTAYSFSAGGPVVEPVVTAIVLTPICPHSFMVRPMVVNAGALVQVLLETSVAGFNLTVDGQESIPLFAGDKVLLDCYPRQLKLVRVAQRSFYCVLREKLRIEGLKDFISDKE